LLDHRTEIEAENPGKKERGWGKGGWEENRKRKCWTEDCEQVRKKQRKLSEKKWCGKRKEGKYMLQVGEIKTNDFEGKDATRKKCAKPNLKRGKQGGEELQRGEAIRSPGEVAKSERESTGVKDQESTRWAEP